MAHYQRGSGATPTNFVTLFKRFFSDSLISNSVLLDDCVDAPQLLPAIDRHGWVCDAPLSLRSISAVSARVQWLTGLRELGFTPHKATGRFKDATRSELVSAQDEVDAAAAELLERSRRLLEQMDDPFAA
jgi:hypothetical protein